MPPRVLPDMTGSGFVVTLNPATEGLKIQRLGLCEYTGMVPVHHLAGCFVSSLKGMITQVSCSFGGCAES